jgi:hypothetical protein
VRATKVINHGITVNVGEDGAWVCFKNKQGQTFCFQPAQQWPNTDRLAGQTIRNWCLEMQDLREADIQGTEL